MNAMFSPIAPLANALADMIISSQTAVRRFMTSDKVPTWTEYLNGCNK